MGIINITNNSYFTKSQFISLSSAIEQALLLEKEGADYLDIGGCSTKPNSIPISTDEEIKRVIPVLKALKKELKIPISIDTYRYEVARQAVDEGVDFINDITGFEDPKMRQLAKKSELPICVMHKQGDSKTMQIHPTYAKGAIHEIREWFEKRIKLLLDEGIKKEHIYIDPGIGFGKTLEHNLEILQDLDKLRDLGLPLLLGTSRKTFIQKLTKQPAEKALYGTLGVNSMLIQKDVDILRVHDVAAHKELLAVLNALKPLT
ncbi:MAG: Dihydropteroate synthase [Chlamydiae bacterium]|nr:Dihydropteroate synthase [Chlamydiota bacterium]